MTLNLVAKVTSYTALLFVLKGAVSTRSFAGPLGVQQSTFRTANLKIRSVTSGKLQYREENSKLLPDAFPHLQDVRYCAGGGLCTCDVLDRNHVDSSGYGEYAGIVVFVSCSEVGWDRREICHGSVSGTLDSRRICTYVVLMCWGPPILMVC